MKTLFINILFLINLSLVFSQEHRSKTKVDRVDLSDLSSKIYESSVNECLQPAKGVLNLDDLEIGYFIKLKQILFADLPEKFLVRYLVRPSFQTEKVLLMDKTHVYYHIAHENIWKEWYKKAFENPSNGLNYQSEIAIYKYQKRIDKNDRVLIEELFKAATSKVCYPNYFPVSVDGTIYSFSYSSLYEGNATSPSINGLIQRLININESIIGLIITTKSQNEVILPEDLVLDIKEITQRFKNID